MPKGRKKKTKAQVQSKYYCLGVENNINDYNSKELKNLICLHNNNVNVKFRKGLPSLRLQLDDILSKKLKKRKKDMDNNLKELESFSGVQIMNMASNAYNHRFSITGKQWLIGENISGRTVVDMVKKGKRGMYESGGLSYDDNYNLCSFVTAIGDGTIDLNEFDPNTNQSNPLPPYNNSNNNNDNNNNDNVNENNNNYRKNENNNNKNVSNNIRIPPEQEYINKEDQPYIHPLGYDGYRKRGRGDSGGYKNYYGSNRGGYGARAGYGGHGDRYEFDHGYKNYYGSNRGGGGYNGSGYGGYGYGAFRGRGPYHGRGPYRGRGAYCGRGGYSEPQQLTEDKQRILKSQLDSELIDIYLRTPSKEYKQPTIIKLRWLNQKCQTPFRRKPFQPIIDRNEKGTKSPAVAFHRLMPDMHKLGWFAISKRKPKSATLKPPKKVNDEQNNENNNNQNNNEFKDAEDEQNIEISESEKVIGMARGGHEESKRWIIRLDPRVVHSTQSEEEKQGTQEMIQKHGIKGSQYVENYWGKEAPKIYLKKSKKSRLSNLSH